MIQFTPVVDRFDFYYSLCYEAQLKIFKDQILSSQTVFTPIEQSIEKLVLNSMLLSMNIKSKYGYNGNLNEIWKNEDKYLNKVLMQLSTIITRQPLFMKWYVNYEKSQPSSSLLAGILYFQSRFFDYADFVESYFDENFDPNNADYEEEPYDSIEDYRARIIRLIYKYFSHPFCKYPKVEIDYDFDIDEYENRINDFEVMLKTANDYFAVQLNR